jgi:hypothetical protein
MKKAGLLILLSASYVSILTLIFSTDYSREHSFLLPESTPTATGKHFENPVMGEFADLTERIEARTIAEQQPTRDVAEANAAEQSPESAH